MTKGFLKLKNIGLTLSTTVILQWIIAPQALAQNQDAITSQQVKNTILQLDLNKPQTFAQFYAKNKNLYSERVQKMIAPLVQKFGSTPMPRLEVVEQKNAQGESVPVIRVLQGNEVLNVRIDGAVDKYVKFDQVQLTAYDVDHFDDMIHRLYNSSPNFRKQVTLETGVSKAISKIQKDYSFPSVDPKVWKLMTPKERLTYIFHMREIWSDSKQVLRAMNKNSSAQVENYFDSKWALFFQWLQSDEALAQNNQSKKSATKDKSGFSTDSWTIIKGQKNNTVRTTTGSGSVTSANKEARAIKTGAGTSAVSSSGNCVVAGYVSSYNGRVCTVDNMFQNYNLKTTDEILTRTNIDCKSEGKDKIACNPYVYGTPSGKAICVSVKDPAFQVATHADGPCEKASPLTTSKVPFLKDESRKDQSRYDESNRLLSDDQIKEEIKKQQVTDSKLIEDYINGLQSYAGKNKIDFNKLTEENLSDILKIKEAFDNDIKVARESCLKATKENSYNEKNFWGACDQLQRRYLFVADYLAVKPGCKDNSTMDTSTLKCSCPSQSGSNPVQVVPGASCPIAPVLPPPPPVTTTSGTAVTPPPVTVRPPVDNGCGPTCDLTRMQCVRTEGLEGQVQYTCEGRTGSDRPTSGGGFMSSMGSFFKAAAPWLLMGVTFVAMWKLWSPKKISLNPAADTCANNPNLAACLTMCTAPKSRLADGTCGCAACPTGTADALTCMCPNSSSGSTMTTYVCADGVTKVTDLNQCPTRCWDGTYVANSINCPVKPATAPVGSGSSVK